MRFATRAHAPHIVCLDAGRMIACNVGLIGTLNRSREWLAGGLQPARGLAWLGPERLETGPRQARRGLALACQASRD